MTMASNSQPPSFWRTVKLLLSAARKRAQGRQRRQQQLLQNRSNAQSTGWSSFGLVLPVIMSLLLNVAAVGAVWFAVETGQEIAGAQRRNTAVQNRYALNQSAPARSQNAAAQNQNIVVSVEFLKFAANAANSQPNPALENRMYSMEAARIARERGGSASEIERKLRHAVSEKGTRNLMLEGHVADGNRYVTPERREGKSVQNMRPEDYPAEGLNALARTGPLPALLGSFVLFWWAIMLTLQGEGLEMDIQRRRHPMWEWLFSHPVSPGAVFLAEILAPIAGNPMFWGGPVFVGGLYFCVYDFTFGALALLLIGIPITVAAACLGKALEIAVILRFSPRTRGAILGLMSWLGYISLMSFFAGVNLLPKVLVAASSSLLRLTFLPAPWLGWFLGAQSDGSFSFFSGFLFCSIAAAGVIALSVCFSVWGAQQGLSGNFASDAPGRSAASRRVRFGREPLYRKEFLWFTRDRSALVQVILVPVSVAAMQVFNLRYLLAHAQGAWNYLSGVAILFGTYFLWILGPKSLQSEGAALWITLTWPRGLENLLKAKAWLWSLLSSGVVAIVLCYAAISFPAELWKIALVGVGWFFFSRSMAEKSVTLVTVTSSSGETEKIPKGRYWAAQLGMFTFAIGIVTQQWQLAIMGIVYSYITAAAMWQNFRARLPYLYDPWSEQLPPAPTLMHAMISISVLVEVAAVLSIALRWALGKENMAAAQASAYALSAIIVWYFVSNFLEKRAVRWQDIWLWPRDGSTKTISALLIGAGAGLVLGIFAHGYVALVRLLPVTAQLIRTSEQQMASIPNLHLWYAVMAIGAAPFAEEYLFRGLLFRALDREWGGWRAVAGSALFFAIYHPVLAWLPVAFLGVANALLFKRTGSLFSAVALHMAYNAVVLLA